MYQGFLIVYMLIDACTYLISILQSQKYPKTCTHRGWSKFFFFIPAFTLINDVSHFDEISHVYFPCPVKAGSQKIQRPPCGKSFTFAKPYKYTPWVMVRYCILQSLANRLVTCTDTQQGTTEPSSRWEMQRVCFCGISLTTTLQVPRRWQCCKRKV